MAFGQLGAGCGVPAGVRSTESANKPRGHTAGALRPNDPANIYIVVTNVLTSSLCTYKIDYDDQRLLFLPMTCKTMLLSLGKCHKDSWYPCPNKVVIKQCPLSNLTFPYLHI